MSSALDATMRRHFATVASRYRELRTTDPQPVQIIVGLLRLLPHVVATDVGCGAGRYDALLLRGMGDRTFLHCIDSNEHMLGELKRHLNPQHSGCFETVLGQAGALPLKSETQDAVLTFNAVHHFPLKAFLEESLRVMKPGGYLLVYTRFRGQNERNVWGRYFPQFTDKEARLFEGDELSEAIVGVEGLTLESVIPFHYRRESRLERLVEQAVSHHYSTFSLYSEGEFQEALVQFENNVRRRFGSGPVSYYDENSLVIARKERRSKGGWRAPRVV
ncbi:MAG: class I SAM-dependent methyltransferase [Chloroflexi bacterium]|nr:class I SAM-dependent methyltransferase [Chloroflexota bacterium]